MIRDLVLFVSIRPILRRPLIHLKVGRLYERIPYVPEARDQHITDGKYIRKMLTFAIRRQKDASRRNQVPRVSCLNVFHVITAHQTDAWLVHRYTTSSKNLHEFFISICIGRSLFSISLANHIKYFSIYNIYLYSLYFSTCSCSAHGVSRCLEDKHVKILFRLISDLRKAKRLQPFIRDAQSGSDSEGEGENGEEEEEEESTESSNQDENEKEPIVNDFADSDSDEQKSAKDFGKKPENPPKTTSTRPPLGSPPLQQSLPSSGSGRSEKRRQYDIMMQEIKEMEEKLRKQLLDYSGNCMG